MVTSPIFRIGTQEGQMNVKIVTDSTCDLPAETIQKYGIYDKVSYISTAGGAFLEFLEGKTLPAVEILEQRAAK